MIAEQSTDIMNTGSIPQKHRKACEHAPQNWRGVYIKLLVAIEWQEQVAVLAQGKQRASGKGNFLDK